MNANLKHCRSRYAKTWCEAHRSTATGKLSEMNTSESKQPSMSTTDGTIETIALLPNPSISPDPTTANNKHVWTLVEHKKRYTVLVNQAISSRSDVHMTKNHILDINLSIAAPVSGYPITDKRHRHHSDNNERPWCLNSDCFQFWRS